MSNFKNRYVQHHSGLRNPQFNSKLPNYSVKSQQLGRSEMMVRNKQQLKMELLGQFMRVKSDDEKCNYHDGKSTKQSDTTTTGDRFSIERSLQEAQQRKPQQQIYQVLDNFCIENQILPPLNTKFLNTFMQRSSKIEKEQIRQQSREQQLVSVSKQIKYSPQTDKSSRVSKISRVRMERPSILSKYETQCKTSEQKSILDVSNNISTLEYEQKTIQKEKEKVSDQKQDHVVVKKIDLKSYMKERKPIEEPKKVQQKQQQKINQMLNKPSSLKELILKAKPKQEEAKKEFFDNDQMLQLFPDYESSEDKKIKKNLSAVIEEEQELSSENSSVILYQPQRTQKVKQKQIKQYSLSDLDLKDISDISFLSNNNLNNNSSHKSMNSLSSNNKTNTLQKIELNTDKKSESQFVFENTSQNSIQKDDQSAQKKQKLQKFVVQDVLSDISELKEKMVSEIGDQPNFWKKASKYKPSIESSEQGSQGIDVQENSMLDFIENINEGLNCRQFKSDVEKLKSKIIHDMSNNQ